MGIFSSVRTICIQAMRALRTLGAGMALTCFVAFGAQAQEVALLSSLVPGPQQAQAERLLQAFLARANSLRAKVDLPPLRLVLTLPARSPQETTTALAELQSLTGLDFVLLSGTLACEAVLQAEKIPAPLLALTPDCAFLNQNLPGFGPAFWEQRLEQIAALGRFQRPGLVEMPDGSGPARLLLAQRKNAEHAGLALFSYAPERLDVESCREALDNLFFDGVDMLVLDGNACFNPHDPNITSEAVAEFFALLAQRGMAPVWLYETGPDGVFTPLPEDAARMGEFLALGSASLFLPPQLLPQAFAAHGLPLPPQAAKGQVNSSPPPLLGFDEDKGRAHGVDAALTIYTMHALTP